MRCVDVPSPAVVLLRPPAVFPKWAHASSLCPSIGLAYLAAAVRRAGYPVRCIDALGERPLQQAVLGSSNFRTFGLREEEVVEGIGHCDILGVSLMFSHDWPVAKSIIRKIRREHPGILIVCGGEHASAVPRFCLEDCPDIDVCVIGEGEETFVDLLDAYRTGRPFGTVQGIALRTEGGFVQTPRRPRNRRVDDIAWPAWDLFPMENYLGRGLGFGVGTQRSMPILVSRGCPFQCTFCSSPNMWTTLWKARSVDDVLCEMEDHIQRYRAQNFDFYDLTAIVNRDWTIEFCEKLIARAWNITWQLPSGTRSEALDDEVLRLMVRAGSTNVTYAPESGSQATLERVKKKVKLDRLKASASQAVAAGLNVKLNMIMGFPFESAKELREVVKFLVEMARLGVHDAFITCFSPYPGSQLFDELVSSGQIVKLDDQFFLELTSYSDIRFSRSYSPHLTDRALTTYRLAGMALFYAVSYAFHPDRIGRIILDIIRGREASRGQMALRQLASRFLSERRWKARVSIPSA